VYEGEAHLFRFTVRSPENFFRLQLPYVVETLKIDPRQIYKLSLYGRPGVGLNEVRLCVSFLKKPTASQVNAPHVPDESVRHVTVNRLAVTESEAASRWHGGGSAVGK